MSLVLGNNMTGRELVEMIRRVQGGQTTYEQEMINNLESSENKMVWQSFEVLVPYPSTTILLFDARDGSICRAKVTAKCSFVTEHCKEYSMESNLFYSHWTNVNSTPPMEEVEAWKTKRGL